MNKLKLKLLACALVAGCQFSAAQDPVGGFQEFRKGLLDNFQQFKARILEHYADFLEGEWHAYEPLEPLKRGERPKPDSIPTVGTQKPVEEKDLAAPNFNKTRMSRVVASKTLKKNTNAIFNPSAKGINVVVKDLPAPVRNDRRSSTSRKTGNDNVVVADSVVPDPVKEDGIAEEVTTDSVALPVVEIDESEVTVPPRFDFMPSSEPREGKEPVVFYGMEILVPAMDFTIMDSIPDYRYAGRQWRHLAAQKVDETVLPVLKGVTDQLGLNDYLTYEFMMAYARSKFPAANALSQVTLTHYLLVNLGLDTRIALLDQQIPLILMHTDQTIYDVPLLKLDDVMYAVFYPVGEKKKGAIYTCNLPSDASEFADSFDFRVSGLNLPERMRRYDFNAGKIHLQGMFNENVIPVLYRYPQMNPGDYAASDVLPEVKYDVARQVREQLAGMPVNEAVNELLTFVQNHFDYATDQELHGFEKPYFFVESLYYPTSDCEDRAIFYTYLLWNALGVENHLLQYPQHESAAVCLPEEVYGTSYLFNGKRYFISDPTYIGATTGMCMPACVNVVPDIDYAYPLD